MFSRANFKHSIDKVVLYLKSYEELELEQIKYILSLINQKVIQPPSQNQAWHLCCCRMKKLSNAAVNGCSSVNSMFRN